MTKQEREECTHDDPSLYSWPARPKYEPDDNGVRMYCKCACGVRIYQLFRTDDFFDEDDEFVASGE